MFNPVLGVKGGPMSVNEAGRKPEPKKEQRSIDVKY